MRRISAFAALAVALAMAAVVVGSTSSTRAVAAEPVPAPTAVVPTPEPQPPSKAVRVYFVQGEQFAPVERRVDTAEPDAVARRAVEWLLDGPNAAERRRGIETALPAGTTLRSLGVETGTAIVELHAVPTIPTAGDVTIRPARAAQIVYTLTALPGVERVLIKVDGIERATFVGSKLHVRGPLDEADLTRPIRLPPRPAEVPAGPAPADVAGVQKRLATLRYLPPDAATGAWDHRTTQAVLAFQGWNGLARDGIVGSQTVAALEVATQPQPSDGALGRHIEVHRAKGVVLLVEGRQVVRAVHASTGGPGYETPTGSYSVFRKETNSWSVPYQVWLPYASYFNGGIAFHASDEVPAHPVSHGCVRLPAPEAAFVYDFATIGTPVSVY
jgi:hypothetical protein